MRTGTATSCLRSQERGVFKTIGLAVLLFLGDCVRHWTGAVAAIFAFFCVVPASADSLPSGWQSHKFNGPNQPTVEDGVVTFQIFDEKCSDIDYGDGRGESDCVNGNVRSTIIKTGGDRRLGETIEYQVDIWINPSFALPSFRNPEALGLTPGGMDSRLRIASWEGPYLHNFIYLVKADADRGITFLGEQCQPPENFGQWVTFSMKVRWASDQRGWIKVTCDDRLVYVKEGVATNQAPHCYAANVCEPEPFKNPQSFNFLLGPIVGGYGWNYAEFGFASPFIEIQPEGITVKMRNIALTEGAELYSEDERAKVAELQAALNNLECDAGPEDGIVGARTRSAALTCRYFADQEMPEALTVATLSEFLSLYTMDGVENLPTEAPMDMSAVRVSVEGMNSEEVGNGDTAVNILATVDAPGGGRIDLDFILIGRFSPDGRTGWMGLLLLDNLGQVPDPLKACSGVRFETWGDGTTHAVIQLNSLGSRLVAHGGQCFINELPGDLSSQAEFLLTNFGALAEEAVSSEVVSFVESAGARAFIAKLAAGELQAGL
jgi:hypothetical protein